MINKKGYFGEYGGCFAPETLITPLQELEEGYLYLKECTDFKNQLNYYLQDYVGRPTPLYLASGLTSYLGGAQIYLKREDLTHTGAHKINNAIGQALLAKFMGKNRLIAETGAGQHGVATATVASLLGMKAVIYMGSIDAERQSPNLVKMKLLGAEINIVNNGSKTLKDATSEAMRDWVANISNSHYIIGSALGPHPYPTIVRDFQKIIGLEAKNQIIDTTGKLPNELVACVGGGSNSIGLFYPFLYDQDVKMTGVEAGGISISPGNHAARFAGGKVGILQGTKTYLLQDKHGQIINTHSISAGLDYPAIGPEHAFLHDMKRVKYAYTHDHEAIDATFLLSRLEGIIPALESAHAIAYAIKHTPHLPEDYIMLINLSGRGDKDIETLSKHLSYK